VLEQKITYPVNARKNYRVWLKAPPAAEGLSAEFPAKLASRVKAPRIIFRALAKKTRPSQKLANPFILKCLAPTARQLLAALMVSNAV
jgi:hypothetical protein